MPAAVITAAVVWLGSSAVLRAEDPPGQAGDWLHHVWQTDEGLPDNTILGISETPDGYLWVATTAGLHRFNGSSFLRFPLHDRHRQPTNLIRSSFTDRAGALWLVAEQTLGLETQPSHRNASLRRKKAGWR
jgi:ligand-binding sensor domain-containing protein